MAINFSALTDAELMERILNNESRALEALYNRYSPILYTLVKKIIGDDRLIEEVVIDVFVIIWRKISYYNPKTANVYCWLVTLARNKAVDAVRRERNPEDQLEYDDDYENKFIIPRLSPQIDDLDLKTAMGIKKNVEEALHKLTDAQQYVIFLAYYEGLTQTQIAQKLKIPAQTVKSKIQIALGNLRDNLLKGSE